MIREVILRARAVNDRFWGHKGPVILMYHQVAELSVDPWKLAVSPAQFAGQIEALTERREIVPLERLTTLRAGKKPLAAITFDDGYRNVAKLAAPILARFHCPATAFLTTGGIGAGREFWWDELSRIVLETAHPAPLDVAIGGARFRLGIGDDRRVHTRIWRMLQGLDPASRAGILEDLAGQTGCSLSPRDSHAIMTAEDVAGLEGGPLSVGAHTVTHPFLPGLNPEAQIREIQQSRKDCEALTGRAPQSFAYPFGAYDDPSVAAVRDAGFTTAVTCHMRPVGFPANDLLLPRIPTFKCGGAAFMGMIA